MSSFIKLVLVILQLVCTLTSFASISESTKTSQLFQNHSHTDGQWKLKLVHRDQISSSTKLHNHSHPFHARMQRDVKRVAALTCLLSPAKICNEEADLRVAVVSGYGMGFAEYLVRVGVGSPPTYQYLAIDTGNDVLWVQYQPCNRCYRQVDSVFNPATSASFRIIPCRSPLCKLLRDDRHCHADKCGYKIKYGDGSSTEGDLVYETLMFGETMIYNMVIGCGHNNQGSTLSVVDGLLDLGGGIMSFMYQLSAETRGAFSYCLPTRSLLPSPGWLEFGRGSFPVGAVWAPLIHNPRAPSFYYIGLSGLGVGGVRLPLSEDIFQLTEMGDGGVILDTGTTVTRLLTLAYEALRDAFTAKIRNLPQAPGVSIFDTCYYLPMNGTYYVPVVSFYFSTGPVLTLSPAGYIIQMNEVTFCLSFAPSPSRLSIIGNAQQEGIQISVDEANGFIGFGPNIC